MYTGISTELINYFVIHSLFLKECFHFLKKINLIFF